MTTSSQPHTQHDRDLARAEGDYRRLRAAYLEITRGDSNEVALAMVGADMERAQVALQRLSGLRQVSVEATTAKVVRRETRRLAEAGA